MSFKEDLFRFYTNAVSKPGTPQSFVFPDTKILSEFFLVCVNDFLNNGYIQDLVPDEDWLNMVRTLKNEAKAEGWPFESDEALTDYTVNKAKKNLHFVLCFSPVGEAFRRRARMFPGLINSVTMDWFHPWPKDACERVAYFRLDGVELPSDEIRTSLSVTMAEIHLGIEKNNLEYREKERRFNYTTPKSFLELVDFYKILLEDKKQVINVRVDNYKTGLKILAEVANVVDDLSQEIKTTMIEVEATKEKTNIVVAEVNVETEKATKDSEAAAIVMADADIAVANAGKIQEECDVELAKNLPKLEIAMKAVEKLDKKDITELKSFNQPHATYISTMEVIMLLMGEMPAKKMKPIELWKVAQALMSKGSFMTDLKEMKPHTIKEEIRDKAFKILNGDPEMEVANVSRKSKAAGGLVDFANKFIDYWDAVKVIGPMQEALAAANEDKQAALQRLNDAKDKVAASQATVDSLNQVLKEKEEELGKVEATANALNAKKALADRLINGLAGENKRWKELVVILAEEIGLLIGNSLLAASFVSQIGPFDQRYREKIWKKQWTKLINDNKVPMTEGVDPMDVLANDAMKSKWATEGLPADRISQENASIVTNCVRWPLLIDPQLQGIKWIRQKYDDQLSVISLNAGNWVMKLMNGIKAGIVLMIEGVMDELDPGLDPVLGREIYQKGGNKYIKIGGEEIEYADSFKLFVQTKLSNPHQKPEIAAQCTIINFIVTEQGLEDQLLALVVKQEKPELEEEMSELINLSNENALVLNELELSLLASLMKADSATILDNIDLVNQLEETKQKANAIDEVNKKSAATQIVIAKSREEFRGMAAEGAMLYFLAITLCKVNHLYQQSLQAFTLFFEKVFDAADQGDNVVQRVANLVSGLRLQIYTWIARGLYVKDKQLFLLQIVLRLMQKGNIDEVYNQNKVDQLMLGSVAGASPVKEDSPCEWLPRSYWEKVCMLSDIEEFDSIKDYVSKENSAKYKEQFNSIAPENEKIPGDLRTYSDKFEKILLLKALRPDRVSTAIDQWINNLLPGGKEFTECDAKNSFYQIVYECITKDMTKEIPMFFILSPGSDPVKDIRDIGKSLGYSKEDGNLDIISMGEGQDIIAEDKLEIGHKEGNWVMLCNIHLMVDWLSELEKKLDFFKQDINTNKDFRVFVSAEFNPDIPSGLLNRAIKLTNEPPLGMKANMKKALSMFKDTMDAKDTKERAILFGLCQFHSMMVERKKFGAKGQNMDYPFSLNDLRDSALVLQRYAENYMSGGKIPWEDLKYLFGSIMQGGHIVNGWDGLMCNAYLDWVMKDDLIEETELAPYTDGKTFTFKSPQPTTFDKYSEHVDIGIANETPVALGMHPNTEISYRNEQCATMFNSLVEILPRMAVSAEKEGEGEEDDSGGGGGGGGSGELEERINGILDVVDPEPDEKYPGRRFNVMEVRNNLPTEGRKPWQNVLVMELEFMNILTMVIVKSLNELKQGLAGSLSINAAMEAIIDAFALQRVPPTWSKFSWPSKRTLGQWVDNLLERIEQLKTFEADPNVLYNVTHINLLAFPTSFVNSIKQLAAQDKKIPLNLLFVKTEVTSKQPHEITESSEEGSYISGFKLEAAKWDIAGNCLDDPKPKEIFSVMPVVKAYSLEIPPPGKEDKQVYKCPVYLTVARDRDKTFAFEAQWRTKEKPDRVDKWRCGGVCCVLDNFTV